MNTPKNAKPKALFEIPAEGTLGLLALGAVGLRMWRKVREEAKDQNDLPNNEKKGGAK
jgi:hypothetical protein